MVLPQWSGVNATVGGLSDGCDWGVVSRGLGPHSSSHGTDLAPSAFASVQLQCAPGHEAVVLDMALVAVLA
jgi:hypothetical protein